MILLLFSQGNEQKWSEGFVHQWRLDLFLIYSWWMNVPSSTCLTSFSDRHTHVSSALIVLSRHYLLRCWMLRSRQPIERNIPVNFSIISPSIEIRDDDEFELKAIMIIGEIILSFTLHTFSVKSNGHWRRHNKQISHLVHRSSMRVAFFSAPEIIETIVSFSWNEHFISNTLLE